MKRCFLAAVFLLMLTGCTALLETGPVIEDDPITASGVDPVEEAIRTWDESHVPYVAVPALRPAPAMVEAPGRLQSPAEYYRYWWKSGEEPEGYAGEEVAPGAADLDWQQAANRADAIRRAVGFPAGEDAVWELTWWPAGADREWVDLAAQRAYYECSYATDTGDLTLRFDSVTGAVQLLQNGAADTTGRTEHLAACVDMLLTDSISDADYASARGSINGRAASLAEQQTAMETIGAALGLPALAWQAVPTDCGTDSLSPIPADRDRLDDSCLQWLFEIGLTADAGDGSVWLAVLDRACGVLRGLVCVPQAQVPASWRPAG